MMNFMSNLFACCKNAESNNGYRIVKTKENNKEQITFVNSIQEAKKYLTGPMVSILSYEKSQFDSLIKDYQRTQKKWTDLQFPPQERSLGNIKNVSQSQWKRISDMLNKPALFDGKVQPKDIAQGNFGDCYFLSALAALAENQQTIKKVFGDQKYNPHGIYKVSLRVNGQIKQILVDDYVPVNTRGDPLFCQPNKNQFWVLILEKAWAKIHGSYANIISGNPSQVFKAVTFAPSQIHIIKQSQQDRDKTWRILLNHAIKNHPSCAGTKQDPENKWDRIGLRSLHSYTIIDAAELQTKNGKKQRMVLLRNPQGKMQWEGEGSQNDAKFWENVKQSQQKNKFLKFTKKAIDGVFFMSYPDFCKYFSQLYFSMQELGANYINQVFIPQKNHGNLFKITVEKQGNYYFQLHQPAVKYQLQNDTEDLLNRSAILIGKTMQMGPLGSKLKQDERNQDYIFVDGVLKYNDEDTTLKCTLQPGTYVIYCKLDPSRKTQQMPAQSLLSLYSTNFTQFYPLMLPPPSQPAQINILNRMFLNHAKHNKRQTFNNESMWIAWKLLFQQGGYAYIGFGNQVESAHKFVVTLNVRDFDEMNFQLLQVNGKAIQNQQVLEIIPGQQSIILARVKNMIFNGLKFPPKIGIKRQKIVQIEQQNEMKNI